MASIFDNLKYEAWKRKRDILFKYGFYTGKIRPYDDELIGKLRNIYYGGIPASIILLTQKLVAHKCYERVLLMTHVFKDEEFRMVYADVDSLRLVPEYIDDDYEGYANHCFVERTDSDGVTWVYDTSKMLMYEKGLYYAIESPKITKINDKETVVNYCEFIDVENSNLENDRYVSTLLLPTYEKYAAEQIVYSDVLAREIQLYKEKIDYDTLYSQLPSVRAREKSKK